MKTKKNGQIRITNTSDEASNVVITVSNSIVPPRGIPQYDVKTWKYYKSFACNHWPPLQTETESIWMILFISSKTTCYIQEIQWNIKNIFYW